MQVGALAGERVRVGVGTASPRTRSEAARVGERDALGAVGVDGVLDAARRPSRERAARSIASASSISRSVVQSPSAGEASAPTSAAPNSSGRPAYSSGSVTAADPAAAAAERPQTPSRRGRSRRRSPSGRRRKTRRPTPRLPASVSALDRCRRRRGSVRVDAVLAPGVGLARRRPRARPRPPPRPRARGPSARASAQTSVPPTVSSEMRTCGWPTPAGHLLAVLAAEAALRCARSSPIAVDRGQDLEAVADQRRAAHRRGDLAVLDQVALGDAEDEVAGGRLDLAARERDRVEARARRPR